jgi:Flp pilus assembly protein TadD
LVYAVSARLVSNSGLAFIIALLFAVHPIHTEPVNTIVGRADLLAFFFSFLAFLCYIIRNGKDKGVIYQAWHIFSLLFYLLGLLSKEHVIVFPLILFCYSLCFRSAQSQGRFLFFIISRLWGYVALTLAYLLWKKIAIGSLFLSAAGIDAIDNPLVLVSFIPRALTSIKILGLYLNLQLFPLWLSPDYSYNQVPPVYAILDVNLLAAVILHVLLFGGGIYFIRRNPAGIFCLLYYLVTVLFISNLFFPIGTIMAERLLYIPSFGSIGFLAILGYSWASFLSTPVKNWRYRLLLTTFLLIIIAFSLRTYKRNYDWRDNLTLFSQSVTTSPNSIKVRQNLGVQYFRQKRFPEARKEFIRAISIKPDASEPYNYLGICHIELGEQDRGIYFIKKAIELDPKNYSAYNNLAMTYKKSGLIKESIPLYQKSLDLNPKSSKVRLNMANAYSQLGLLDQALVQYQEVLRQYPRHKKVYYKLGKLYLRKGLREKAREEFKAELEINPGDNSAMKELAKLK